MAKKNLSTFLKDKRVKAGFTQAEIAKQLGYTSPQFVSNWERGMSNPPIETLKQIGKLYSVSMDELYDVLLQTSIEELKVTLRERFYAK